MNSEEILPTNEQFDGAGFGEGLQTRVHIRRGQFFRMEAPSKTLTSSSHMASQRQSSVLPKSRLRFVLATGPSESRGNAWPFSS